MAQEVGKNRWEEDGEDEGACLLVLRSLSLGFSRELSLFEWSHVDFILEGACLVRPPVVGTSVPVGCGFYLNASRAGRSSVGHRISCKLSLVGSYGGARLRYADAETVN